MEFVSKLIFLFYIVLVQGSYSSLNVNEAVLEKSNLARFKRQNGGWTWGLDELNLRTNQSPQRRQVPTASPVKREDGSCAPYKPVMPNFRKPGRRISEVKCYEYIWEIRNMTDKENWDKQCLPENPLSKVHISVVGGRNTRTGEFPHMGAIGWEGANGAYLMKCGGSLISTRFVLTAAHCSKASDRDTSIADPVPKIVRFGDRNIWNGKILIDVKITRIFTHPQYKPPKKYNDIALFELERDMTFSKNVHPACVWNDPRNENYGTEITVTGWGVTEADTTKTSNELQAAAVDTIKTNVCEEYLAGSCNRLWCGVYNQICAGKLAGGVDTCQGDSGGPLQVKIPLPASSQGMMYFIIGITQFGIGCAQASTPGIYTKVSSYIEWIENIVWNNRRA